MTTTTPRVTAPTPADLAARIVGACNVPGAGWCYVHRQSVEVRGAITCPTFDAAAEHARAGLQQAREAGRQDVRDALHAPGVAAIAANPYAVDQVAPAMLPETDVVVALSGGPVALDPDALRIGMSRWRATGARA